MPNFMPKIYNEDSFINAFGFSYSMTDFRNWEKNRIYDVSKEIQYKAIINSINTSLPQFIIYYYFKKLGFECEYELEKHIPENILNIMEEPRNYTLDLYNPNKKIVIEYDGREFHKRGDKDINRDRKILTGPLLRNPIANYIIRIREGYLLYKGKNPSVKEYKIFQFNQGFNKNYQDTLKEIYNLLINEFGPFKNEFNIAEIDPVKDENQIRVEYFEYAEKIIENKGESIFDYYPYKDILKLYEKANREIPSNIDEKHFAHAIRTAYKYNTKYVIEAINKEYKEGDTFYQTLQKLETKYPTLKRAEQCDANRIVVQDALNLVLFCKRNNNEILLNDLISGKIDNKAEKTLVLSDTQTQLEFSKKYDGVDSPFYTDKRYKLMNYRKNEEGQICPDPNVLLLHKIKYEEEEWALWHEIQSFSKEFQISPLQSMFKKIMINKTDKEIKNAANKFFDHFLGLPQKNMLDIYKSKKYENTTDILTILYENKTEIADFLRARTDFYQNVFENKTDDQIYKLLQKSCLKEKNDYKYQKKKEVEQNLSFASTFGISSLDTLLVTAKDKDDLNKILNSYGVNVSAFKNALAHDYIMKKHYNLETTQFATILKKCPDLFPDFQDLSLKEISNKAMMSLVSKDWSSLVPPYFINTQAQKIREHMSRIKAFKEINKETANKYTYKNYNKYNKSNNYNKDNNFKEKYHSKNHYQNGQFTKNKEYYKNSEKNYAEKKSNTINKFDIERDDI